LTETSLCGARLYIQSRRRGISYINSREANWVGHYLRRNFLLSTFLKEMYKRREDEKDDVGCYWMIATKREDTGN
jgi:hypothetical protein